MNLNEIETSAPRKYRAVHKETGKEYPVVEIKWDNHNELAHLIILTGVLGKTRQLVSPSKFHPPDQFTGHVDRDGKEIYGGDVGICWNRVTIAHYNNKDGKWVLRWFDKEKNKWSDYDMLLAYEAMLFHWIGNIHNPDALPEEVRRILDVR